MPSPLRRRLLPFAAIMALAGGAAGAEASRQFDALARLYEKDKVSKNIAVPAASAPGSRKG